ncbi:MAG: septum formation initiator family protein [Oscillospiraceae bacterium]|nr:septum formation initiator family protein [Oscillospiraceae bacterium]
MTAAKPKKRVSLIAALVVLILLVVVGMQLLRIRDQLIDARAERDVLAGQVAQQEQENRALEAALERAEDPEYLQELARDQLGMVSPGQKDFYDVSN